LTHISAEHVFFGLIILPDDHQHPLLLDQFESLNSSKNNNNRRLVCEIERVAFAKKPDIGFVTRKF